jgi:Zn-dependent protease with chaperone function
MPLAMYSGMRGHSERLLLPAITFAVGLKLAFAGSGSLVSRPVMPPTPTADTSVISRAQVLSRFDLPDAAVAIYDSGRPRILVNPILLAQVGPALSAFLLAHEQGHLAFHHARTRGFGLNASPTPVSTLRSYEFAADCYAVRTLHHNRPDAVVAAIRFFQRRSTLATDAEHPPMGERADSLLSCLGTTTN